MCFMKAPKPPKPLPPAERKDAATVADEQRRRLSFRRGAANSIHTSPLGDPRYGSASSQAGASGVLGA